MIQIALVEDNPVIIKNIEAVINQNLFNEKIEYKINSYESSESFLAEASYRTFQIVILDIELPKMSGIDLAQLISESSKDTIIIFLTSYEGYMKHAFGLNVYRYIMKADLDLELPSVLHQVLKILFDKKFYVFKTPLGIIHIDLSELVYIEFIDRNPHLTLKHGDPIKLSASSLKALYREIDADHLLLINNRTIVNMNHISELVGDQISLKNNFGVFQISRVMYRDVYSAYHNHLMLGDAL